MNGCRATDSSPCTPLTTVDELWHFVEAAWATVLTHDVLTLYDSMSRRITAVIAAEGGYSKY